jgi:hypothetical protein
MTKTGQTDHPAFITIPDKAGSEAYALYVTITNEGPMYDTVGIDREGDEFEVTFESGCATFEVREMKWLILDAEQLVALARLIEAAEHHYQAWCHTEMGQEYIDLPDDLGSDEHNHFLAKYADQINVRKRVYSRERLWPDRRV